MKPITQPKKILIQRADRLGDVICTLPVIDALQKKFPNTQLDYLTSSIGSTFLKSHKYLKKIHTLEIKNNQIKEKKALVNLLKKETYDVYLSLWNHPSLAKLGVEAKIPNRIGDKTNIPARFYYTHPIRQWWEDYNRHQIEFNMDLLQPFNIQSQLKPGQITIPENDLEWARNCLQICSNKKPLVIFTGTGGTNHPIPETAVKTFIEKISAEHHWHIILAGQQTPNSLFNQYQHPNVLNLLGKTTLFQLMGIIHERHAFIGPDTGPTHLASFMQKPLIVFSSMKPNPPNRWGPLSPHFNIMRQEYNCPYPCFKQCHPQECFSFVTPELLTQHFNKLCKAINSQKPYNTEQIKTQHRLYSLRVLYIYKNKTEQQQLAPIIEKFNQQGLRIFATQPPKNTKGYIDLVIKHNINILQGNISKLKIGRAHV